jgi:hypothetical protein
MLTWGLRYDASIFRIEPIAPSTDLRRPNEETNKQRIKRADANKQTNRRKGRRRANKAGSPREPTQPYKQTNT